jgi:hypothetical protein
LGVSIGYLKSHENLERKKAFDSQILVSLFLFELCDYAMIGDGRSEKQSVIENIDI